jgi:hypothetical protein
VAKESAFSGLIERLQRTGVLTRHDVDVILSADRDDLIYGFLVVLAERNAFRKCAHDQRGMLLRAQNEIRKLHPPTEALPEDDDLYPEEELESVEAPNVE